MFEGGVSERRGEGLRDCDGEKTQGDADAGENARGGGAGGAGGVPEVDVAYERGAEGLHCVEHERGAEDLSVGAVGGGGNTFLEKRPGQAIQLLASSCAKLPGGGTDKEA